MTRVAVWLAMFAGRMAMAAAVLPTPSPFRMNQVGFATGSPPCVMLVAPDTGPIDWSVIASSGAAVRHGRTLVIGDDPVSGEHLHRIAPGKLPAGAEYVLTAGGQTSRPFAVATHPFAELAHDAIAFFQQQRSGTAITPADVPRPDLARAAGHASDIGSCFAGRDAAGVTWPGCPFKVDATGGWYDAGDQGKYVVNGGIAVWTLLDAYERDGTHRLRTLLDTARWEIEFLLRMQVPAGAQLALRQSDGQVVISNAGGLAFAKIADAAWTPIPTAPADDRQPRIVYPPSTAATLNLAAVAAQCARVWRGIDAPFAAKCLSAARRAYDAAQREPALIEHVEAGGSGSYDDTDTSDEQYWAAAELFVTTGEPAYAAALRASRFNAHPARALSWSETETAGQVSLALGQPGLNRDAARDAILAQADRWRAERLRSAYAIPFAGLAYPWGSNSVLLNRAMVLGVAYDFTHDPAYRDAETDALDYVLGRNALDRSYVTGYGARPVRNPHHRFWAHQADPRYPAPPPGVLVGGPNSARVGNMPISTAMTQTCVPMACWRDDYRVFTENEVAISWQAPLVWVALHLDEGQ